MARLFAMGTKPGHIARIMGMSLGRVYIFSADPAFNELVANYRETFNKDWAEDATGIWGDLNFNLAASTRQIREQLEDADETQERIPLRTLKDIAADAADRVGFAKRSISINVDGTFAAKLDRAIERSGLKASPKPEVIDTVATVVPPPVVEGAEGSTSHASEPSVFPLEDKRRA